MNIKLWLIYAALALMIVMQSVYHESTCSEIRQVEKTLSNKIDRVDATQLYIRELYARKAWAFVTMQKFAQSSENGKVYYHNTIKPVLDEIDTKHTVFELAMLCKTTEDMFNSVSIADDDPFSYDKMNATDALMVYADSTYKIKVNTP